MIECLVTRYGADVRSAYRDLLPEQSEPNAKGKLDWKFKPRTAHAALAALARDGDQILGMSTYLPADLLIDGVRAKGYQAIDSVVREDARGAGLFTRLARSFNDDQSEVDVVWGFPNAMAARPWFHKLQWTKLGTAPFLVKPLRAGYFFRRFNLPLDIPLTTLRDESAPVIHDIDDTANVLWEKLARKVRCAVVRDHSHLKWRLFECPSSSYRTVALRSTEFTALVSTYFADKHGGRIGYIMEAMGERELPGLLRSEVGYLKECGVEVVLAWCFPWSPNYAAYIAAGFLPFPNPIRPIQMYFGARAYGSRGQAALSARSWYLSYLDSDTV